MTLPDVYTGMYQFSKGNEARLFQVTRCYNAELAMYFIKSMQLSLCKTGIV